MIVRLANGVCDNVLEDVNVEDPVPDGEALEDPVLDGEVLGVGNTL